MMTKLTTVVANRGQITLKLAETDSSFASTTSCSEHYLTCQTPFLLIHYHYAFKPFYVYFCVIHFFGGTHGHQDETLRIYNYFVRGPSLLFIGVLCHPVWQSRSLPDSVVTGDKYHVDGTGDDPAHFCTLVRHAHTSKQWYHTYPLLSKHEDPTEIKKRISE